MMSYEIRLSQNPSNRYGFLQSIAWYYVSEEETNIDYQGNPYKSIIYILMVEEHLLYS